MLSFTRPLARMAGLVQLRSASTAANAAKPTYTAPASVIVPTQFKPNTKGQGLMQLISKEETKRLGADGRSKLFNKSHQDCLRPGDVVLVETLNSMSTDKTSTFIGVLIAMDRRGLHSNFTVRNVVLKVGVEMKYMLYSPLIKAVRVMKKGEGFRRAKLFYLRDNPGRAFRLEGLVRQDKAEQAKKAVKA
ncbi:translation protein SH3-like domain-containing protein [Gamsiella multidivaricata]|uniref:translation protein SH3-like domain-containing protein n=1 Tax=Gamsiella multidivaricata TaxID=101098 RepID=UPI00221F0FEC|nr:translation protein SH3-like domain-containing protein [Gamsiella multidivaricata]KAG0364942.1 hypothetical protein BGZ54_007011 [Gamsiella multidivaricata]KAI7819105.1 translation protein SH3-like domain-containing protein [Gamsiella multidivaricata]